MDHRDLTNVFGGTIVQIENDSQLRATIVMTRTVVPYFLYSAGILFREGLEAMLVVIALVAATRESGREGRARDIYGGALAAIAVSIALAWGVNHLISDDATDTMEGIFQVLAAATLFYVSSWLTSKSQADSWKSFINAQVKDAVRARCRGWRWG